MTNCQYLPRIEAARDGVDPASQLVLDHAESCDECSAELQAISDLAWIARELPTEEISDATSERAEALLAGVKYTLAMDEGRKDQRRRYGRWLRLAVAAVFLIGGFSMYLGRLARVGQSNDLSIDAPTHRSLAVVQGSAESEYRSIGEGPDQVLRLASGRVDVEVEKLEADERFRVVVGDAEVEVRGTMFEVLAAKDELQEVRVFHGSVEVRFAEAEAIILGAGDLWTRPVAEPEPVVALANKVIAPTQIDSADAVEELVEEEATPPRSVDFSEGMTLLRAGDFSGAAERFAREAESIDKPLHEDALFWLAVSLSRSGAKDAAAQALRQYLTDYPGGIRAGEVHTMLAWWLDGRGEKAQAAEHFKQAIDDPSERVRQSAADGLRATGLENQVPF